MRKLDTYEQELLIAYEKGELRYALPLKVDMFKFKAAATATLSPGCPDSSAGMAGEPMAEGMGPWASGNLAKPRPKPVR
jgi:hypothetical protein